MPAPFTNVHIHVFNSACAPDNFLRILPMNFIRKRPETVKNALDSKGGRKVIQWLFNRTHNRKSDKRRALGKYVAFLDVGTQATQRDVFLTAFEAGKAFDPSIRLVGLTMNMDYMDSAPSGHLTYETQLNQVMEIKRFYPANFFPFLGIDPRHKTGPGLVDWAKPYFETTIEYSSTQSFPYFCGLKLYPALGFFPFDPALKEIYKYAEENNLPLMSHCTRVGSQYIGDQIEGLIPPVPPVMKFEGDNLPDDQAAVNATIDGIHTTIVKRIEDYRKKKWIRNSKIGDNDIACDLFGHPENYVPILEMFPKLKLCLAHMGGSNEIEGSKLGMLSKIRRVDPTTWFDHIRQMMCRYRNLYTDISYTLSDFAKKDQKVFNAVKDLMIEPSPFGGVLGDRVLFGTDFFMTEQEGREPELYAVTKEKLGPLWDKIGRDNPERFLMMPGV